jgi:hypothetical protein
MDNQTVTPTIRNLAELKAARKMVKIRVKLEEQGLKNRLQELPGQLLYTGFKHVIPPILSGRITNTALGAGKSLVDMFFVKKNGIESDHKSDLSHSLKKAGLLTALKWGFRILTRSI